MVSANKLIYDFVRKLNSVNSGRSSDFRVVDIVSFINEAYEVWFENKVYAAETNSKLRNDLRVFEIKDAQFKISQVDDGCEKTFAEYPEGFYKLLNMSVTACNNECCGDIVKNIIVSVLQSDDLRKARKNPMRKSDFKWERLIADEAGSGMYLYHDGEMEVKKVVGDYYRKPKYIQAPELVECEENAYRNYDNELITENVDLEVDTFAGRQIVDIAVLNTTESLSDYNAYQAKLKSILQLDTLYR